MSVIEFNRSHRKEIFCILNKWRAFLPEEISAMSTNKKTLDVNTERNCPCCHRNSIRHYYREINICRLIGTSWYWCYNCYKYIHFTVAPCSKKYIFNDPISDVPEKTGDRWYDYLNTLWEEGVLPQVFKKRK